MISGASSGAIGMGIIIAFGFYGILAGSIHRVTSGSLAGWNFAGNYITTLVIVSAAMIPVIALGPSIHDALLWASLGAAAILGLTEIKRRDL